ncbi:MAG: 16S rRNA (adenine(1518)-N(6)/adenine(1519)-N(6))-dimethyltransferase RsmA [Desulfobacterales bacterium]|nr:16S rRNA (adenine(1518)-N(6)/adenine(1519)-N(6))-dimethyltransferase RsmA [Desulfobacterales bacterium]
MTTPRTLLNGWRIQAKKQLGQNFLNDPSVAEMIVRRAGIAPEEVVVEIGAGMGALTLPVSRCCKKVYAIEKDPRLIPLLKAELLSNRISNVIIIENNALTFDFIEISEQEKCPVMVIGNLPYNISSQVLIRLIHARKGIDRAVLMFQKELAQRLMAQPGIKDYGRLSVMIQYCAEVGKLAEVKANLFFPRPKVDSEVLTIKFHQSLRYPVNDEIFFHQVVKAAFGQRRKTLKNALAGSLPASDRETVARILDETGIDPNRRAETLSVENFVRLAARLKAQFGLGPNSGQEQLWS